MRNTSGNQTEVPSEKVKHSNEIDWKKLRRRYKKVFINQQDFILGNFVIVRFLAKCILTIKILARSACLRNADCKHFVFALGPSALALEKSYF